MNEDIYLYLYHQICPCLFGQENYLLVENDETAFLEPNRSDNFVNKDQPQWFSNYSGDKSESDHALFGKSITKW